MNIDPYKANEKMQNFLKKTTQKISNNEINKSSQKPIIDSQKRIIDKCKKCEELEKDLKLQKENVSTFCNLIDPTRKKSINKCIEDLKKILEDYEILLDLYKITIKFIEQQEKGRPKINLDTKYIKYLRDIKKMTFEEIAKKYNVSRNTIRNRYYNN